MTTTSNSKVALLAVLLSAGMLAGCGDKPPAAAAVPPAAAAGAAIKPSASLQEVMNSIVDPAADTLWDAVSTEVTKHGVVEKQPRNAEEWQQLRHQAVALQEAGNLLLVEGRHVVAPGGKVEDSHVAGVHDAATIEKTINDKRSVFANFAASLRDTAGEAIKAIDAHDAAAVLTVGSHLEHVCESCHSTFWYPDAKRPQADGTLAAPSGKR